MILQNILSEIETVDPEIYERLDTRRDAMKQFANFSGKVAVAALPFALGSMFKKAYGQTPQDVINTLQFALGLEYLEAYFYNMGTPGIASQTTAAGLAALQKITADENQHVVYLKSVISALGATPNPQPTFDLTAGNGTGMGPFVGWNTNYDVYLAVAQTFEDTGVRAYKGSAGSLINNKDVLTAALNIHSVEARHAAHLREMRRARGVAMPGPVYVTPIKPWIENAQSNIGSTYASAVAGNYSGEDNTTQLGLNVTTLASATTGTTTATVASAAFDEPLTMAQVTALVDPFIV